MARMRVKGCEMSKTTENIRSTKLSPLRIAGIYCAAGMLWIIGSSVWVSGSAPALEYAYLSERLKGVLYVFVTAALLWLLCKSWASQITKVLSHHESSQKHYKTYVQHSPIAIGILDPQGRFLDVNLAACKLTGYPREELIGKSIFELDPSPDAQESKAAFAKVRTDGIAALEHRTQKKDGTYADVQVDGVKLDDEKILYYAQDVTGRKANEQKLLMLNAMLRAIRRVNQAIIKEKEISPLIQRITEILVKDRNFDYAWIALFDEQENLVQLKQSPSTMDTEGLRKFIETHQFPKEWLNAHTRSDGLMISTNPSENPLGLPLPQALREDALICAPVHCKKYRGYISLLTGQTVAFDEEELTLFREVAEDLKFALHSIMLEEDRVQAMNDLTEATHKAEAANEAKDRFLAIMSHEMRTPLNPIMGHCDLLLDEIEDPESRESLLQINSCAEHLLSLIDEILYFTNLHKTESASDEHRTFDVLACCDEILRTPPNSTPEVTIRFENGVGLPHPVPENLEVSGAHSRLIHILRNLLSNACKYTAHGHIILRVGLENPIQQEEAHLIFQIEDTGIGIPPQQLEDLFDPFTQVDSSYTRRYEGVGLGLAICRKLSELMEGSLDAQSTQDEGSCFTFRCTMKARQPESTPTTELDNEASPPKAHLKDCGKRLGHVLIVEDNPGNALVIEAILKRTGYTTSLAQNGHLALNACNETTYDLILMDLSMPVINGFKAAQEIRNGTGPNKCTPIIGLSAHALDEAKDDCLHAGMNDYLTKPVHVDELVNMVGKHLNQPSVS